MMHRMRLPTPLTVQVTQEQVSSAQHWAVCDACHTVLVHSAGVELGFTFVLHSVLTAWCIK